MDNQNVSEKLNKYNLIAEKFNKLRRANKFAVIISNIIHILMLLPFTVNFYALTKIKALSTYGTSKFFKEIQKLFPLYNNNIKDFCVRSAIALFAVPLVIMIMVFLGMLLSKRKEDIIQGKSELDLAEKTFTKLQYCYTNFLDKRILIFSSIMGIILSLPSTVNVFVKELIKDFLNVDTIFGLIWIPILFLLKIGVFVLTSLVLGCIFMLCQSVISYIFIKRTKNKCFDADMECMKLYEQLQQEAKEKAEWQEEERKRKLAREAEEKFNELIEQDDIDFEKIKKLADDLSPSACLYVGRKLYMDYINNEDMLTKREKASLFNDIKNHLQTPFEKGNIEAQYLLLSIKSYDKNKKNEWEEMLQKARRIRKTGKLPDEYSESLDLLIKVIVATINSFDDDTPSTSQNNTSNNYIIPPPKPEHTFCWNWDMGCTKKGGACNGWCPDFYSMVDSIQKEHEAYLRWYNSQ